MLNLAFCDDDKLFLKEVVPIIENEFKRKKMPVNSSLFTDGEKLIKSFKSRKPQFDIVFLDIDIPNKNGKAVAKELRTWDKTFILVFLTAYEQEALNMFQYDVLAFLPKNKLYLYLGDAVKRAIEKIEEEHPQMQFFRVCDTLGQTAEIKIPLNDIKFIECLQRKIFLHSVTEVFQLHQHRFTDMVKKYIQKGFLDIHRTCIVNPQFVVKLGETSVWLDDGTELPMSRRKKKQVLEQFIETVYEGVAK